MCTILQEQFSFLANSEDVAVRMHFKDFFSSNHQQHHRHWLVIIPVRIRRRESDDDEKCRAKMVLKVIIIYATAKV